MFDPGHFKSHISISDYNVIITAVIDTIATYNGFKQFSIGYYNPPFIIIPDDYKYILKNHCEYRIEDIKNISSDEVRKKMKRLFLGLKFLNMLINEMDSI